MPKAPANTMPFVRVWCRMALLRLAPLKSAACKLALLKLAPLKSAACKLALLKLAPLKSGPNPSIPMLLKYK